MGYEAGEDAQPICQSFFSRWLTPCFQAYGLIMPTKNKDNLMTIPNPSPRTNNPMKLTTIFLTFDKNTPIARKSVYEKNSAILTRISGKKLWTRCSNVSAMYV